MKKDFHYYLIYALAERTGWKRDLGNGETEADIIAYASQYVDDNTESQAFGIKEEDMPKLDYRRMKDRTIIRNEIQRYHNFPWAVRVGKNGDFFRPIMTQTVSLKSLVPMFQKYVIMPFHFLPGDKDKIPEIKERTNPYSTTPNSANAIKLLKDAFDSTDVYRIGVALHTFADTWSHQNFTGYRDDWNAVRKNITGIFLPDIGHAEVTSDPDIMSKTWTDSRLSDAQQEINNAERAAAAVKEIFQWLSRYGNSDITWQDARGDFERFIAARNDRERIRMVMDMYPGELKEYTEDEERKWIDEALEYDQDEKEVFAKAGFENTHWYKFQLAAKKHLGTVVNMLADIM